MNQTPTVQDSLLIRLLRDPDARGLPFSVDVGAIPGLTDPLARRFREELGDREWADVFDTDYRICSLSARFGGVDAAALHGAVPPGTTFDEWGIGHWAGGDEGTYEQIFAPLADVQTVADVERHPDPRIEAPATISAAIGRIHARGLPVFAYAGSIYEWAWWLRGMENFMMDMAANPAFAEALIRKTETYTTRLMLATAEAGADVLCVYDDAGMQTGMQLSPDMWRRYVKPAWQRALQRVRERFANVRFFFHCCGKIDPIIADIVDVGFDILHPIQPECMDFDRIHREFGRRIITCATLSDQRIMPFATPDEVRAEVRRLASIVRRCHGRALILPSNRLQPETPWSNIMAFVEETRRQRDEQ